MVGYAERGHERTKPVVVPEARAVTTARVALAETQGERTLAEPMTAPTVVHVVVAGECGGAERFLVELASRPRETRARHVIALMTPSERLLRLFEDAGLSIHDRGRVRENPLAYLWRSFGWSDVAWLAQILRRERASIAHLHTFQSHVVGTRAARIAGVRVLRTEHDTRYFEDPSCAAFTGWSIQRADTAVAVSGAVERFIVAHVPHLRCQLRTIRNGVDTNYFTPPPPRPVTSPLALAVLCRLEPVKQVHLVLQAVARVGGVRLEVIGDGSEMPRLRRLSRELGIADRVTFHGFHADPRGLLGTVDAVVSASRSEALGLSLLEAQAMARAVIGFGVGGVPEVVVDGETGVVITEPSVEALTAAIAAFGRDVSGVRRMGQAARAYVEAQHGIDRMCAAYGDVYARLAKRHEHSRRVGTA